MEFKDYYAILGVDEKADAKEIKSAYRKLARKYHPDVSKEADAGERFKELGEAYEVLKDPEKRAEYDQLKRFGAQQRGQFRPPPDWEPATNFYEGDVDHQFSDFFESIFGRSGTAHRRYRGEHQQSFRMRGEDIHLSLPLLLEEIFSGGTRQIEYSVPVIDEQGLITHKRKKLSVRIPAQVDPEKPLLLKGQGSPGIGDAPPGDLLVNIQIVPHPEYTLNGKDLHRKLKVMPWVAALGGQHSITLLDGQSIKVTVPANSNNQTRLRLKNKGLSGGDLYLELSIGLPKEHSERAKDLYRQLAEEYSAPQAK